MTQVLLGAREPEVMPPATPLTHPDAPLRPVPRPSAVTALDVAARTLELPPGDVEL